MRLTSDYRHVIAIFDTQHPVTEVEREDYRGEPSRVVSEFQVGPILYWISFEPHSPEHSGEDRSEVDVNFDVKWIEGEGKKLVQIMSQLAKEPLSLKKAKELRQAWVDSGFYDAALGLGGKHSIAVLGTVINTIKSYVNQHHPDCITFAGGNDKMDVYEKLARRAFPQAVIEKEPGLAGADYRVCFKR